MAKSPSSSGPGRAERQAAALRANLKRRKAGQAERAVPEPRPRPDIQTPSSRPLSGDNSRD
jgi:hypothetical protein